MLVRFIFLVFIGLQILFSNPVISQFFTEDFESGSGAYSTTATDCNSGSDYFTLTNDAGIPANFTGSTGNYFAAQDIDGCTGSRLQSIEWTGISIAGCTSLSFNIDLAEDDDGSNEDWDDDNYVRIFYSIDGGAEQNLIWIHNDGSTFNSAPFIDTDFDGVGDGAEITDVFTTYTQAIPGTGTTIDIRIEINLNDGDEDIAFDNLELSGTCGAPNTITTTTVSPLTFNVDCSTDDTGTVDFTTVGTFAAGNNFTAQLSDATGSFASSTNIGSIVLGGTDPSGTINITIPSGTANGTGYRIRVISDTPNTIGSDNGTDITINLSGGPCIETSYDCGTVIWYEDFESYTDGVYSETQAGALVAANNNTINPNPDWTCHGNNCDADGDLDAVNDNYFGISTNASGNKEFRVNDIEGLTCCGSSLQGENDNYWETEEIDISSYTSISIAINARVEGDVECTTCGDGRDEFNAQYSTDGGTTWSAPFYTICGAASGFTEVNCIDVTGSTLIIRVLLGNQANDENYFFDDIIVCESSCSILLPVEIHSFYGEYDEYKSANSIYWTSESEKNNNKYILFHSTDGKTFQSIGEIAGAGNSSSLINYSFDHRTPTPGINYYKLQSIDYDGKVHEKGIIAIDYDSGNTYYDYSNNVIHTKTKGNYNVVNLAGQIIKHGENTNQIEFFGTGIYIVQNLTTGEAEKLVVH
jgi:hypothetical protein